MVFIFISLDFIRLNLEFFSWILIGPLVRRPRVKCLCREKWNRCMKRLPFNSQDEKSWEIILGRSVYSVTRKILSLNFWVRYIGKVIIKTYIVLDIISTRENNLCVVKCWIAFPMTFECLIPLTLRLVMDVQLLPIISNTMSNRKVMRIGKFISQMMPHWYNPKFS